MGFLGRVKGQVKATVPNAVLLVIKVSKQKCRRGASNLEDRNLKVLSMLDLILLSESDMFKMYSIGLLKLHSGSNLNLAGLLKLCLGVSHPTIVALLHKQRALSL